MGTIDQRSSIVEARRSPASSQGGRRRAEPTWAILWRGRRTGWLPAFVSGSTLVLAISVSAYVMMGDGQEREALALALLGLLVTEVTCLGSWYARTGRLFDPYTIVVGAVWLFNGGGLALGQALSPDLGRLFRAFHPAVYYMPAPGTTVLSLVLVSVSLLAAHAAALLFAGPSTPPSRRGPCLEEAVPGTYFYVGATLVALSVVPAVFALKAGYDNVAAGGYMALFQSAYREDNTWYARLSSGLVPGLFYVAGSTSRGRIRRACYLAIAAFSVATLGLGTRAVFYSNIVSLFLFHHLAVRRFRGRVLVAALLGAAVLSTGVAAARLNAGRGAMTAQDVVAGLNEQTPSLSGLVRETITGFFEELGTSVVALVYTVDLVPATKPHEWGLSYYESLLTLLPADVMSSLERGARQGAWLIETVSPSTAAYGGGIGFSILAEAYDNFGWAGPPLVMTLLLLALTRLSRWVTEPGAPWKAGLAASAVSILIFSGRGSSFTFVRRMAWLVFLPYAAVLLGRRLHRPRSTVRRETPIRPGGPRQPSSEPTTHSRP
jgi:hypothetical protein